MALSERLAYVLDFNVQGAVKSLQKVGDTADKELGKVDKKLDKLGANLTKFGTGALAVAGIAGVGLAKLAQGAADTEAGFEALNQVVGETTANSIADWAEDGAQKFGLAKGAIFDAATTFGMFGKEAGLAGAELEDFILKHVQLAADWSAFKNVSPEQVIQDVRAAYAGSSETLQKYIGTVNDAAIKQAYFDATGEKVTGTLTGQQRIIGINTLMYEKGADMMGQFTRESDSMIGQQVIARAELKNLADEIGTGVVPFMTKLLGVAQKLIAGFSKLNDMMGGNLGTFAAYGVAGLAVVGVLSSVAGMVIKARDNFKNLGTSMSNAGGKAKGFATALGVAGIALAAWQLNASANAGDINDMAVALANTARETDETAAATVKAIAAMGGLTGDLKPAIDQFVKGNIEAAKRLIETGAAAEGGAEFLDLLTKAIAEEEKARKQATATVETYTDATEDATGTTEDGTAATEDNTAATKVNTVAQQAAQNALDKWNESARAAFEEQKRLTDARRAAADATFAARQADASFAEQVWNTTEILNDSTASTQAKQIAVDEAVLSAAELADAELRIAQETATANGQTLGAKAAQQEWAQSMIESASQLDGPLRQAVLDYVAQVTGIPAEKVTEVFVDTSAAEAALDAFTNKQRFARVDVVTGGIPKFHDGGVVPGPVGSEQLAVLKAGETVLPTHKSSGGGGAGVAEPGLTAEQIYDAVFRGARDGFGLQGSRLAAGTRG